MIFLKRTVSQDFKIICLGNGRIDAVKMKSCFLLLNSWGDSLILQSSNHFYTVTAETALTEVIRVSWLMISH